MDLGLNIEKITVITDFFRIFFIEIFTFLIFLKISNQKFKFNIKEINWCIYFLINDIIISFIKYEISYTMSIISLIFLLSIIFSYKTNNKLGYTIILTIISLSIKNFWTTCHIDGEKTKLKRDIEVRVIPQAIKVISK